jgi:hypothetical protein
LTHFELLAEKILLVASRRGGKAYKDFREVNKAAEGLCKEIKECCCARRRRFIKVYMSEA